MFKKLEPFWYLIFAVCVIFVLVMMFLVSYNASERSYRDSNPICTVTSKQFYVGLFQKTYKVFCDDRYVFEIPEGVWLYLSVGDQLDTHSYKKVVEP